MSANLKNEAQNPEGKSHTSPPRINLSYLMNEMGGVLSFQKGILYTIKELSVRPGTTVRSFLYEDRKKLARPILFLVFCSLIYTLLQQLLHFEDAYFNSLENETQANAYLNWIRSNWGYVNIFMCLFYAFGIKIFYWKRTYNYFELLVLLFYLEGITMLIYSIFGAIEAVTSYKVYLISSGIGLWYLSWGIAKFYQKPFYLNFIKALFAYLVGLILFGISATLVGVVLGLLSST